MYIKQIERYRQNAEFQKYHVFAYLVTRTTKFEIWHMLID